MKDELTLLKFPDDHGRVEACLKTVMESLSCEVYGDYYIESILVELVNIIAQYDLDDVLMNELYINLMRALMMHREINNE